MTSEYWTHCPKFIPSYVFRPFYDIIKDYCQTGVNNKRISCFFDDIHGRSNNKSKTRYKSLPGYSWTDAPDILVEICNLVEDYTKFSYDYVLVHIYTSGKASIAWHNDKEALNSAVTSVSLGATRKFRLKELGRRVGWDVEISLENGDLLWMHGPDTDTGRPSCQRVYCHTVPVEKNINEPRINLTFRQYE